MAFSSWITDYLTAKGATNLTITAQGSGGKVLQARDLEVGGLNRVLSGSVIASPGAYVAVIPADSLQDQLTALAARVQTAAATLSSEIDTDVNTLSGTLNASYASIRSEIDDDITALSGTLNASYASIRSEIDDDVTALSGALNASYASIRSEIDDDVTALSSSVATRFTSVRNEISSSIAAVVNGAPATLDTLKEIGTALGNNASLSSSLATKIGQLNVTDAALQTRATNLENQFGGTTAANMLVWASGSHASGGSALKFGNGSGCARMKVKVENATNDLVTVTFDVQ